MLLRGVARGWRRAANWSGWARSRSHVPVSMLRADGGTSRVVEFGAADGDDPQGADFDGDGVEVGWRRWRAADDVS